MAKKTKEQFIEEARQVWGDKFDYSKVEYKNAMDKVIIVCPEHGEFVQTPSAHLNGQGCPKCVGKNLSVEDIIKKFKDKHGDKYDYSKVEYVGMHEKVCIICPKHGEFWQIPNSHLQGNGCPSCVGVKKLTHEEFVKENI